MRVNISQTTVFLCTRLSKSTEQDWEKLRRLLDYLQGTANLRIVLGSDGLSTLRVYADASYPIHVDMKGHTGGLVSLGKGTSHTNLSK